ncbi:MULTISPECIES: tipN [Asticcacaulis]|uniref:tipN n=1 Tax=Asticcacaulis TaxID=76890 RepID=UPI00247A2767|nr:MULTISPECIES: tipN [Asticcacaulis]MBP2160892.1 FtsZ-binding cell division protein ZapB [Asticcacaulis solisilvae]MDR6801904.1 FtsZ-binding cell division protein ZapB [Asticcacaulis sp. BE141]
MDTSADADLDASADDLLEAPLDAPLNAPLNAANPTPVDTEATADLDIPHAAPAMDFSPPPPPDTPPARFTARDATAQDEPKAGLRRDLTPRVETEGVLKATGASPMLFWGTTGFISLLWACGLAAFMVGAQNNSGAFTVEPFRMIVIAFLAVFPVGLIFASAFALRNAAALSRQSARAAALADSMLAPATSAAMQTHELVDQLRTQVDHAVRAVRLAHADITELQAKLKSETDRLHDAANIARATTMSVTRAMEQEREAVARMSEQLAQQANGIIEAVDRQARMVADASDLAQTQLREAEATLAVRATDMMTAANDVSTNARLISEDLDRQTQRLETAGSGVAGQIRSVEEGLSQQRAGLVAAALSLRADQEDFAVHIENQRAQLTEALAITRVATVDLGETSARGVDVLRDIVQSAQEQFRAVLGVAENERTSFETRIHATLSNISVMAADARDDLINETRRSLEQLTTAAGEAKKAADTAAQVAQGRVDRLNESIFEASKKADEVFDSRFAAARRLIEDSAELINQAGDQTAERLDNSFAHTRQTIAEVNEALNELTHSADQLPLMAQDRLHEIRSAVEEGLAAMTAAARKAALETEAVDSAFQDRVRRNYDMLTEAVRLMGVISGDQPLSSAHLSAPTPPPVTRDPRTPPPPMSRAAPQPPQAMPRPTPTPQPAREQSRLRLTPLPAETRPAPQPQRQSPQGQKPQGTRANESNGWSWRDLLNGMDSNGNPARDPLEIPADTGARSAPQAPVDADFDDDLDEVMVGEVSAMGVDAASLLSRTRIDEMITSIMAENNEGARNLVRRIAPAAVRRLNRRLMSDPVLRQHASEFVTAYDQQVNIALMSKDASRGLQEVLGNDKGRAYLLIDAAIADII